MALPDVDVRRFTRAEYERLAEGGFLEPGERVELIDGVIYNMPPQSGPHATVLHLALKSTQRAFPGVYVRVQSPLSLGASSQPEPDIAVVAGTELDYLGGHPTTALLVIEVADSSLLHDRRRKVPLYARAGIPEVWVFNLLKRCLEVYRDPAGDRYRTHQVLHRDALIAPLANPSAALAVGDMLPAKLK
jgi:Uma2 family endonuclease